MSESERPSDPKRTRLNDSDVASTTKKNEAEPLIGSGADAFDRPYRGRNVVLVLLLFGGVLMGTHEGEFWPYSIYPMFSKAGQPWTRAAVFDVSDLETSVMSSLQDSIPLEDMRHRTVPVSRYGVDQIDFSNYISKTRDWTPERTQALRVMFMDGPEENQQWLVAKVRGRLDENRDAEIWVEPLFLMRSDSVVSFHAGG